MADCGLLNLASCLPQAFFEYISSMLNAPIQPLLTLTQNLLSARVDLSLFSSLWAIIIYMLSMFYALLLIYSGFQFIVSGYDFQKRENAKLWLRNIVIMIILVQASFFIYDLFVQLSSVMTSATLSLANQNFFLLTIDNISNVALEIMLFLVYIITLLITSLVLIIRYGIVAVGVVLFPIAIFFYFIPALRDYGLLILNFLGISVFVTFIDAIFLVGFSKLVDISFFANVKILVMISAFGLVNIFMLFIMFFSIIKAGIGAYQKVSPIISALAAA
jgi:hypothetical protein